MVDDGCRVQPNVDNFSGRLTTFQFENSPLFFFFSTFYTYPFKSGERKLAMSRKFEKGTLVTVAVTYIFGRFTFFFSLW